MKKFLFFSANFNYSVSAKNYSAAYEICKTLISENGDKNLPFPEGGIYFSSYKKPIVMNY